MGTLVKVYIRVYLYMYICTHHLNTEDIYIIHVHICTYIETCIQTLGYEERTFRAHVKVEHFQP